MNQSKFAYIQRGKGSQKGSELPEQRAICNFIKIKSRSSGTLEDGC